VDGIDHFAQMCSVVTHLVINRFSCFQALHGGAEPFIYTVEFRHLFSQGVLWIQVINFCLGVIKVYDDTLGIGDHHPFVKIVQNWYHGQKGDFRVLEQHVDGFFCWHALFYMKFSK